MQIALWNHHTPYLYLLATALPEHTFALFPTAHAPTGWREDQRPRPENAQIAVAGTRNTEVLVCQTPDDRDRINAAAMMATLRESRGWIGWLYLAHNRHEFDGVDAAALAQAGVRLVCISEMKAETWRQAGYDRPITVIRPGIRLEDYGPWEGDGGYVLTVANNLRRPLFDLDAWLQATRGLPVRLVGGGNDGIPGAVGPAASWEALKEEYRRARVYLSVNKWNYEDGYSLALLEAMATGCPCVVLKNETAPYTLKRAEPADLRARCEESLAFPLGGFQRGDVAEAFPFAGFAEAWRRVLEEVRGG